MMFEQLIGKIEKLKTVNLKGIEAHRELAPPYRVDFKAYETPKNAKKAGVLALLYPDKNNQTNILLTLRATYKGTHSNQISFPGGKINTEDINLEETALRETLEETGIKKIKLHLHSSK